MKTIALSTLLSVALLSPATLLAQSLPFPPTQSKICESDAASGQSRVSKKKMAQYLLQRHPFNAIAVPEPSKTPDALAGLDVSRRILGDADICKDNALCSKADVAALQDARGEMVAVLINLSPGLRATDENVDVDQYFASADDKHAILCLVDNGRPIEAPGAIFTKVDTPKTALRIRGKVNDLIVDRASEKEFQGTSGVSLNYASDGTSKKDVETLQAVVGYHFRTDWIKGAGEYSELIPYGQINRILVKPDSNSSVKTSLSETFNFGLLSSFYFIGDKGYSPLGHYVGFRPDFLIDTQDGSRILSFNTRYLPVKNGLLNDYIPLIPGRDDRASFKPIFDLRGNIGRYTDRGNATVAANHDDFFRVGSSIGLSVIGDHPDYPFALTTSYIKLIDLAGDVDVGYLSNKFEYFLHPKKYFSVSLTHSNGNREDTAKRESLWMAGLNAKF